MFTGLGLSGFIPVIHGVTIYGYKGFEDRIGVTWIGHGAMYIFGAALYVVGPSICLPQWWWLTD